MHVWVVKDPLGITSTNLHAVQSPSLIAFQCSGAGEDLPLRADAFSHSHALSLALPSPLSASSTDGEICIIFIE